MTTPTPSMRDMAESLLVTTGQAIRHGVASDETYRHRLGTWAYGVVVGYGDEPEEATLNAYAQIPAPHDHPYHR